jgi:hypothetical protein
VIYNQNKKKRGGDNREQGIKDSNDKSRNCDFI